MLLFLSFLIMSTFALLLLGILSEAAPSLFKLVLIGFVILLSFQLGTGFFYHSSSMI